MKNKLNVVIIEDDFRIAAIHKEMIEQNDQFTVTGSYLTAQSLIDALENNQQLPDAILLDMYIPDVVGFSLLETMRMKYPMVAVIVVSAADDIETVRRAILYGVFDYLIKPIQQSRLQAAMTRLALWANAEEKTLTQGHVDKLLWGEQSEASATSTINSPLPKGIDKLTLEEIKTYVQQHTDQNITAQSLSEIIGISRSTARRYLEYMVGNKEIQAALHYGQVGRPQRIYFFNEQNEQN
ncbi:MAG TPA: response regulator [Pseudogracilibacillus sp.]|nr:response regulator [Pseudogracilibacillus sp.]